MSKIEVFVRAESLTGRTCWVNRNSARSWALGSGRKAFRFGSMNSALETMEVLVQKFPAWSFHTVEAEPLTAEHPHSA